jgi:hypothetical protein
VAKRRTLEERLLDNTIDNITFKRLHVDLESKINAVDLQLLDTEGERKVDFQMVERVLELTRHVYNAYLDADMEMKRNYLKFFFDEISVDDGEIVEVKANTVFSSLRDINQVISKNTWLPRVDSNHQPAD